MAQALFEADGRTYRVPLFDNGRIFRGRAESMPDHPEQ